MRTPWPELEASLAGSCPASEEIPVAFHRSGPDFVASPAAKALPRGTTPGPETFGLGLGPARNRDTAKITTAVAVAMLLTPLPFFLPPFFGRHLWAWPSLVCSLLLYYALSRLQRRYLLSFAPERLYLRHDWEGLSCVWRNVARSDIQSIRLYRPVAAKPSLLRLELRVGNASAVTAAESFLADPAPFAWLGAALARWSGAPFSNESRPAD